MKGKLIVIEGTDCSGKETQTLLLEQKLNNFIAICGENGSGKTNMDMF